MESNIQDPIIVRRYLLCDLTDERLIDEVAEAMLRDDAYAETVELAEEDLIEDYLEQKLSRGEQRGFEKRLVNSLHLRQRVGLVKGLRQRAVRRDPLATTEKPRFFSWHLFRSPVLRFAVVLIGLTMIGFAVWRIGFVKDNTEIALGDLRRSVSGQRITLGRSTLDSTYSPVITTRGPRQSIDQSSPEFRNARALLLTAEVEDPRDAKVLHLLGLLYLAETNLDNALAAMLKAEKIDPSDPVLLADIGAVYLEKAEHELDLEDGEKERDLAVALDYTERSLAARPDRLETLFNRALILEAIGLSIKAKEEWGNYLTKDPDSEWAAEARNRLETLEKKKAISRIREEILSDFWAAYDVNDEEKVWNIVSETKEMITDSMVFLQLTGQFAEMNENDPHQKRLLNGMAFIGSIEEKKASDKYFSRLSDYYTNKAGGNRAALREAREKMADGYASAGKTQWEIALDFFDQARGSYIKAENTWEADIAEYQICYVLTQLERLTESSDRLRRLAERNQAKDFRWPTTLAYGWIGSNFTLAGEQTTAISFDEISLNSAAETSDSYNLQRVRNQMTHQFFLLGDEKRTLSVIGQNREYLPKYSQSNRERSRNLLYASLGFYKFGYFAAAAATAEEQLVIARDVLDDKWMSHTAHSNLADSRAKQGNFAAALESFDACFKLIEAFPDEKMRRSQEALTRLHLAEVQREMKNCPEAIGNYDKAIVYYEPTELRYLLYQTRSGRLKCLIELDRGDQVSSEMSDVILLFEKNRRSITDEAERNIFFDQEQTVYDLAAQYAYRKLNDPHLAFRYLESSKARSLLDRLSEPAQDLGNLAEIQTRIPANVTVLYYAVLPERTLIWTISNETLGLSEVTLSSHQLGVQVQDFIQTVMDRRYSVESSNELYEFLIRPARDKIEEGSTICIVPDKILNKLPFAALRSRDSRRFLIEDFPIVYSPSVEVFTRGGLRSPSANGEKFFSVGASVFDTKVNPGLDTIEEVDAEARLAAAIYDGKSVAGKSATKEAVLKGLRTADIFHYAGHYVANARSSDLSKFLLADGDLTIRELTEKFPMRAKLVVLSACNSGVEAYYSGEGMVGAASEFLAGGVPVVIASHWPIESFSTADLMTRFHSIRTKNKTGSVEALRSAQIEMINGVNERTREPYHWAGMMPVGTAGHLDVGYKRENS